MDAHRLPGSAHVGIGKRLLERYDWWRFEPHPKWVEPSAGEDDYVAPYASGIPGEVRVIYFPRAMTSWGAPAFVKGLEAEVQYTAFFYDPKSGREVPLGEVEADAEGSWRVPSPTLMQDWVLVLECVDGR